MSQGLKDFVGRLQKSDGSVKKRYLIIFSAITMAVVIGLWIFYLKVLSHISLEGSGVFLKNFFIAIGHWLKDIFFKIKLGKEIIIER